MKDIPLIIPNFNQLTYIRNLINWWKWYYPYNPVVIVDNGSCNEALVKFYDMNRDNIQLHLFKENDFCGNLKKVIDDSKFEYYVISDPDIMPHPATPPNFLQIFKSAILAGFHHVGFDLITIDIPEWNTKAGHIQGDEASLKRSSITVEYEGKNYHGYKAPIDTTFALYSRDKGDWSAPMDGKAWDNSLRLFQAFHLTWYMHPGHINDEMKHYFSTCLQRDHTKPSAGRNHYRPE